MQPRFPIGLPPPPSHVPVRAVREVMRVPSCPPASPKDLAREGDKRREVSVGYLLSGVGLSLSRRARSKHPIPPTQPPRRTEAPKLPADTRSRRSCIGAGRVAGRGTAAPRAAASLSSRPPRPRFLRTPRARTGPAGAPSAQASPRGSRAEGGAAMPAPPGEVLFQPGVK